MSSLIDLVTGKVTTRQDKTVRTGRGRHAYPPQVRAGLDAFGVSTFNMGAVEQYLAAEKAAADALPEGKAKVSALSRCTNDRFCLNAVRNQRAQPVDPGDVDGFWTYEPAYRVQRPGRLSQIGGGFQSCSREMKQAAYSGVPGVVNYDLRASQAMILIVLLREAGIDPWWIVAYVALGKAAAAEHIGISIDLWKKILYALLMGANAPSAAQARLLPISREIDGEAAPSGGRYRDGPRKRYGSRKRYTFVFSRGTLTEAVLAEAGPDDFEAVYGRLLEYTEGLRDALALWHTSLETSFVRENGWRNPKNGMTYLTNEVGMKRAVEDRSSERVTRPAEIAAFLLQGREAAFTHALAASAREFGFHPLSYEHDGLVVQGVIPQEAVERAAGAARLPMSQVALEPKPFV